MSDPVQPTQEQEIGEAFSEIVKLISEQPSNRFRLELRTKYETIGRQQHPMQDLVFTISKAGEKPVQVELKKPITPVAILGAVKRIRDWLKWRMGEPAVIRDVDHDDD